MEEEAAKEKQGNLGPPVESIIPRDIPQPWTLQYDPVEISRQMTIIGMLYHMIASNNFFLIMILDFSAYMIEWEIWSNIQHWELLNLAWTKKDRDTAAKNGMLTFFI